MGFKRVKSIHAVIDRKLHDVMINFGNERRILTPSGKINLRQTSRELADVFEEMRWKLKERKDRY
jgi:hypothetical protein